MLWVTYILLLCLVDREEYETLDEELMKKHEGGDEDQKEDEEDEDRPVQGPINREPYEKLYPGQKESGIRKMYVCLMRLNLTTSYHDLKFSLGS